jgi:hypothetical protein
MENEKREADKLQKHDIARENDELTKVENEVTKQNDELTKWKDS